VFLMHAWERVSGNAGRGTGSSSDHRGADRVPESGGGVLATSGTR
jgi:hypothetical protein